MQDPDWLLDATPRKVQIEALRRSYGGFKLWDNKHEEGTRHVFRKGPDVGWGHYLEMRLGKTPTAINEFELFARDHGFTKILVISPNTYKHAWVAEAVKLGSSVPWVAYESTQKKQMTAEVKAARGKMGIVVNYEALSTDYIKSLLGDWIDRYTLVVIDESIKIKDHSRMQSLLVREYAARAGAVRLLSGLPMVQGPQDLYAQFRAVRRMEGVNFYAFRNKYCIMGGFKGKKIKGVKNEHLLREVLAKCSFIAHKRDWGKQTDAEHHPEMLSLPEALAKPYNAMLDTMVAEFTAYGGAEVEVSAELVLTKLLKLAQISSGFVIDDEGRTHYLMDPTKTPKMERLKAVLDETKAKVVVPYVFQASGEALGASLAQYNPAFIKSKPWMKKNGLDVESEKNKFNRDPTCRLAIVQMVSGKYGHDLSGTDGDRCSTMVFYENTFSLDDRTQIEMRNTTAFQDWSNDYFDLVSGGVELMAAKALARKRDVAEAVLGAFRK